MNNLDLEKGIVKFDNQGFSIADFVDADHLSDTGAKRFTNFIHQILRFT